MPKVYPGNKGGKRKSIATRFVFLTLTLCQQRCLVRPRGCKMNEAHSLPPRPLAGGGRAEVSWGSRGLMNGDWETPRTARWIATTNQTFQVLTAVNFRIATWFLVPPPALNAASPFPLFVGFTSMKRPLEGRKRRRAHLPVVLMTLFLGLILEGPQESDSSS